MVGFRAWIQILSWIFSLLGIADPDPVKCGIVAPLMIFLQPDKKPSHAFGIKHSPYLGALKGDAWGGASVVVVETGRGNAAVALKSTATNGQNGATNGHSR